MKQGWEIKKLGDICYPKKEIKRASTYCSSSDRITYIDISSIDAASNRIVAPNEMLFKDAPSRAQQMVMRHDVLVSLVRPNLKNIAMVHTAIDYLVASSGFCVLRTKENPYYIKYLVTGEKFTKYLMSRTSGANYPAVREDDIRSFQICVPPIAEQEKIVAELDCLSGIIEKKKQQLKELDNLAQSIFYEMFGDPVENDKGWKTSPLHKVSTLINGRAYKQNELLDSGKYRVLRVGNFFTNGNYYYSDLELEDDKYCDNGDLLFAWSASFGAFIWNEDKVIYHYHIWKVLYDNDLLDIQYYRYLLNTMTAFFMKDVHGIGMVHLTKAGMEQYVLPLPPLALQQDFASKIESIEKQKELIAQSIKETETLFNSRMDYYFN